ncbi:hypothetical protein EDD11_006896 [Mortierella claussenii]|nr:hypothetical protein EDD11_006896 [Mortierella claussenii]
MAFFNKIKAVVQTEGARGIRQVLQKEGTKRFAQDLSANLAVENISFCTFKGAIAVTGAPDNAGYLELEEAVSVKMMAFQPGAPVLIVIDAKNAITVFDLIKKQRLFVRNARSIVTCMELLAGSNWLFHGLKDGTIDVFDVYKGQPVSYKIPNIIPEGSRHSLVVSIKTHPKDNNQLLIAYNTGIALWNLKLKSVTRTFIYEIPPGAMGGIAAAEGMFGINESRYPHVTVIAWRPDGLGFVSGYDDGCFVFWDTRQERPILARTINELQVNVPGIRPVFERNSAQFVPIYQLCWCLHDNKEDTTLIVAGGTSSVDLFGLHLFEFPNKADYRNPRRQRLLSMDTDILDFIVLPRDSPWFNGALDPVSILVLTNHGGVKSFSFDASHVPQTVPSTLVFVEPRLVYAKVYGQVPPNHYERLIYGLDTRRQTIQCPRIPLRGIQLAHIDESRLCRDILLTAHADSSIRFWEAASLQPLHHLTVELGPLFFKNQGEISMLEYNVYSQVLAVGFSNGNWIYGRLGRRTDLSQHSTVASTIPEEPINEELAANLEEVLTLSGQDNLQQTRDIRAPHATFEPQHNTQKQQHSDVPHAPMPQLASMPQSSLVPQPEVSTIAPPSFQVQECRNMPEGLHVDATTQSVPIVESQALTPNSEDLGYLIPYSPVDPVEIRELPPTDGLNPALSSPERAPSPSLPPRPAFVESTLPNGSEFSPVYKSSAHLGRINQIAISECGLVAVSDEFYALSITDTQSGKVLHVEDLKVVMLDCDKTVPPHEGQAHTHPSQGAEQPPVDPQSLQRVGVVITTLQFVVSTTSDQDKLPSLLLIAGSTTGIYLIFAVSPPPEQDPSHPSLSSQAPHSPVRHVRKVETFQTKEQYTSIHTSIISVMSPPENSATGGASKSTSSVSSVSSMATSSTTSTSLTQPSLNQDGSVSHPYPSQAPSLSSQQQFSRRSEDGSGFAPSRRSSLSESSGSGGRVDSGTGAAKPSIYSTLKEAQGKVMSKAQQRLNYLVCVSEHGLRLHMNCTSRRINKIDTSTSLKVGKIMAANVVYHGGACCILCITESGRILLFSVPKLELIPLPVPDGEMYLPIVLVPERLRECVILPDGRIFVPILKYEFRMYSLWGHDRWVHTAKGLVQQRSAETSTYLQLYDHGIQIPPRPTNAAPQASRGWFGMGSQAVDDAPSQEDLDELLGGEHYKAVNPILKRAGVQGPPGMAPPVPLKDGAEGTSAGAGGLAGMMGHTIQSLDERGKKLGELGDKTAEMSAASNDFLAAARELNAKNANKKWYEF